MTRFANALFLALFCVLSAFCVSATVYADDGKIARCRQNQPQILAILESEGVSADFYWLMVAESGCRPGAKSHAGAVGFWQMMPRTMRAYGCNNENDLECQTRAAARYIKSLQSRFKTVEKTVIAWNMGGHNYARIGRATREAKGLAHQVIAYIQNAKKEDSENAKKD